MGFTLALLLGGPPAARGVGFTLLDGDVEGHFDTTIAVGATLRTNEQNPDIVGIVNGGNAYSINGDDGNLNFGRGDLTSLIGQATHELQMTYGDYSVFARGFYFYDTAVMDIGTQRTTLLRNARRRAGWDVEMLDYFVTGSWELGDRWLTVRAGNQVLNWGESTFIQNGINVINHINVQWLRSAAAELRQALLPIPAIDFSLGLTEQLSLEGYYQLYWDHTEIEAVGTFFSTNDFAGPGGQQVYIGFGLPPIPRDNPTWIPGCGLAENKGKPECQPNSSTNTGLAAPREKDNEAQNMGQGGLALRYFSPTLNDTEFGLFWSHYHSRLPVFSGRTGDLQSFILGDYASSARYFREFPENIDSFGASFSTEVGPPGLGIAIQGEASFKPNQPLQADDVELLFSALSPLDPFVRGVASNPNPEYQALIDQGLVFGNSQLGAFGPNEYIKGYRRHKVFQWQYTVTMLLGPNLGMDQVVLLGEMGGTWVPELEDKDELRYEGPGTYTSGNPFFTTTFLSNVQRNVQPATEPNGFADPFSWGYRLAFRGDLLNAIGPINLQPILAFQHDVDGTTPSPILNFVDDRKSLTLRLDAVYLEKIRGAVEYTNFFEGGRYNLLNDRDFVNFTMSYFF